MKYFALRLAAAEVGAARTHLHRLGHDLGVEIEAFPDLVELQEPLDYED